MKTPEVVRRRALAYYYAHREQILTRYREARRARGIGPRQWIHRTREERLQDIIYCNECGAQVTTPSLILRRSHQCIRCRRKHLDPKGARRVRMQWRRTEIKRRYRQLKAEARCKVCGTNENLDFHHRDPSAKLVKVSRLACQPSWSKLLREIEKCDVLCRACHEAHHNGPVSPY